MILKNSLPAEEDSLAQVEGVHQECMGGWSSVLSQVWQWDENNQLHKWAWCHPQNSGASWVLGRKDTLRTCPSISNPRKELWAVWRRLAAVRGTVGQNPLSLVFYDCNFRLMDWCAVLQGYWGVLCVVSYWMTGLFVDKVSGNPLLVNFLLWTGADS